MKFWSLKFWTTWRAAALVYAFLVVVFVVFFLVTLGLSLQAQVRFGRFVPGANPAIVIISTTTLPSSPEDVAYPATPIVVTGGTPPYTCAVTGGSLPSGLSLSSDCNVGITGTPPTPGAYPVTITATDAVATSSVPKDFTITITATGTLPSPWAQTDVGSGQAGGSASESSGTWTVTGAGIEYGTSDKLHMTYISYTGNLEVIAHVTGCTGGVSAECGTMIRTGLAADAPKISCFINAGPSAIFQWRLATGAATGDAGGTGGAWVRARVVNGIGTCWSSTDGTNWTQVGGDQSFPAAPYFFGLKVNSYTDAAVATGTFTGVSYNLGIGPVGFPDSGAYRPSYQGPGTTTPGARGGAVCKVTSIADTNTAGTLRYCLTTVTGARYVVFEVSGTIALVTDITITSPFVTIAGQTAPSPGITVRNYSINVDTHDIVFQHFRFRMGDTTFPGYGVIGIWVRDNPYNIVFDHMSISWATSTNLSMTAQFGAMPHDVAILDCIISEGLGKTGPGTSFNGIGSLYYANPDGTGVVARTLYAHNGVRNPWVSVGYRAAVYNNVSYNPTGLAGDEGTYGFVAILGAGYPDNVLTEAAVVNNVFKSGPSTHVDVKPIKVGFRAPQVAAGVQIYLSGNTHYNADGTPGYMTLAGDQWAGVTYCNTCGGTSTSNESNSKIAAAPAWYTAFDYTVMPNASVEAYVLLHAGARPQDRDAVDARVVANVTARTGTWISSQSAVGGWPTLAVNSRTYTVPANPNNPGSCGSVTGGTVRTIIECDLETKAQAIE